MEQKKMLIKSQEQTFKCASSELKVLKWIFSTETVTAVATHNKKEDNNLWIQAMQKCKRGRAYNMHENEKKRRKKRTQNKQQSNKQ